MRVERLELNGFKSFADKTVFKFHPGTTAIVGPNGCGKSNIVDAFKWVLGEQSAKSLRGGEMADVIFAGSATKKTKGMAEVTLVLTDIINENSDVDTETISNKRTEVAVTRRLFRSGESVYLMNKVPCRLKDIKDMFLDTGLELKAYSILEQGRIGDIINSKPQDRRFLIEEIAGVMKYKIRKHEATNKLKSSKTNLQRIQDIIAEVKRQINTIDRHAKKAERYKKIFEELKDIELRTAKRDVGNMKDLIDGYILSEDDLKSREAESTANVHATEAMIEEKKRLCIEHERSLNEIRTNLYAIEREIAEDEGKVALLKNECENLRDRQGALKRHDQELDTKKEENIVRRSDILKQESELSEELSVLEARLNERNAGFADSESEINEFEHQLDGFRSDLFRKAEEISNLKNEVSHFSLNIDNINKKAEKNSQDIDSLKDNLSSLNSQMTQTRDEHIKALRDAEESKVTKADLVERLRHRKEDRSVAESVLQQNRVDLASKESKLEALREQDSSQMKSFDESIRTMGQVADIVGSLPEYETAIEAILGDKLSAAVVEDNDEINRALQFIKEKNTKRSGFITLNPFKDIFSGNNDTAKRITESNGVVGAAVKFISVKDGYEKVADSLLKNVFLVNDLKTAFSLWEEHCSRANSSGLCFVTLEGDVLEPSGMVFGGTDKGVLKIKRLIKELEQSVSDKQMQISEGEGMVASIREDIISIENNIISADAAISSREKYAHQMEMKVANLEEENTRLHKKHEYISIELDDDHRVKEELIIARAEKEADGIAMEEEKMQIEERIRSLQNIISEKKQAIELMRSEITGVRVELTAKKENMASIRRELERLNVEIIDIETRKQNMVNEDIRITESILVKEEEIIAKDELLKAKVALVSELQGNASKVNEVLDAKTAELAIIEKQLKEIASGLESMRSQLNQIEMKKMEQTMKLNYLKEDMVKTYSTEIETADISDVVTPEEEERLPELKARIQSIGPVSLGTIDEYEELKTRYEFLTKQRDDLEEAIASLEDTIKKINKTSEKRLMDAFDALNAKFKEVFMLLFGKGRAELQLTEGSIHEAGIEIIAQPPGKRLQNLNLLSGGEKAMTALSLLFAGFMIKPTPLCLLDEVDAPLDEANTEKFINLIRKLAGEIQFITITHNRRTMEAANYMYGITMEEPGSSKTVSMHLAEAV